MDQEKKIRVLIADDSAFMRKVLHSIINADPQLEVVGEARDGKATVAQAEALRPDVITMDINMPGMDGLQATELIMSSNPRPILIVSSESREGAEVTLKALELGAIDFVAKPSSGIDLDMNSVRDELCRKIKTVSKVRVVRTATRTKLGHEVANSTPRSEPNTIPTPKNVVTPRPGNTKFPFVVIAASTGGPAALMRIIPEFPADFQAAVILVQHIPPSFSSQFSQQLAEVAKLKIKEAEAGEIIVPGTAYVCPGSHHMRVSQTGRVTLDDGPRINGYRPCADVTFETVAEYAGPMSVGVVLTGMGGDAVRGAQVLRSAGGYVIAQDEASSVIFGMNAEVIKAGAVDQIASLESIYAAVEKRFLFVMGAAKVGAL